MTKSNDTVHYRLWLRGGETLPSSVTQAMGVYRQAARKKRGGKHSGGHRPKKARNS